jgi:hypothetical protein
MLSCVTYIASEMLANDAVPVRRVFFVEEGFNKLGDVFLGFFTVNCFIDLGFHVLFHLDGHFADFPLHNAFCHI